MTLDQLIHDPNATAQQILHAAGHAGEIRDAAAKVYAQVVRLCAATNQALMNHQTERAESARAALQDAWQRWEPWQEALSQIDEQLDFQGA